MYTKAIHISLVYQNVALCGNGLIPKSRSNIKITVFEKMAIGGHSCFTNTIFCFSFKEEKRFQENGNTLVFCNVKAEKRRVVKGELFTKQQDFSLDQIKSIWRRQMKCC